MGPPLRVLIVEDVQRDALLLVRELRRGGFDVTFERVDCAEAMSAALTKQAWDLVLSDYFMPRFSAPLALELVKERKIEVPFIIVSGTVAEDLAVEMMHAGAHDFLVKGKLGRLIPAIERELQDTALRLERTKMQEQLIVSDRMASVGVLAAGVAHEINNPLAALMANQNFVAEGLARFARDVQASGSESQGESIASRLDELKEAMHDARESAERVRHIVRDLKVFSRSDENATGAVDVRRVMESSLRMAFNEIRHRARLVKNYGAVPPVEANEGRLGQVFLNLIVNAAQAIEEGWADRNEIRVTTRMDAQGRVVVEVGDTGSGIPDSIRSRVFDPFFTTKPIGVGTGLGLAICHRIVTALGGQLEVESQVGVGSVFRATLPVAKGEAECVTSSLTPVPLAIVPGQRRGRILVVDDEPLLGAALRRMLTPEHEVLTVTTARDALGRLAQGARFDVIFCDLMMPELTGMDLYAELMRLVPLEAEKVVFMTGGAFTSRAREFLDQVPNPRLEKPFDAGSVRALVRGLLR